MYGQDAAASAVQQWLGISKHALIRLFLALIRAAPGAATRGKQAHPGIQIQAPPLVMRPLLCASAQAGLRGNPVARPQRSGRQHWPRGVCFLGGNFTWVHP
mmetsp:Transcript_109365/g.332522  ORF Transcript_109365/g.332522 Transcript_109365/m.332522 type:complete len:101 (-) Transcript_109365:22-324(-)